jgi:hypothetical protein
LSDPVAWAKAVAAQMPGVLKDLEADPTNDTISQRAKGIRASGGTQFGFGNGSMTADQIAAAARQQAADGQAKIKKPLDEFIAGLVKLVGDAKAEDVTGAGGLKDQLKTLILSLQPALPPTVDSDGVNTGGKPGAFVGAGKARSIDGDAYAKIGLFVGGAGGPAVDFARRTAIGVEKLYGLIKSNPITATKPIQLGYI